MPQPQGVGGPTTGREDALPVAEPLLLADAMLGRLAKWLRLLGFDTLYAGRRSDHQIAALARAEGRIVLTRDREMTRRKGICCLYVDSQVLEEQLAQVLGDLGSSHGDETPSGAMPALQPASGADVQSRGPSARPALCVADAVLVPSLRQV